jgi:pyridoxine 5-phosphate synthase
MPRLGVNIDHIATLRQARKTTYPDPIQAAKEAEKAGADQIVCHLREDRRHIQDEDLRKLRKTITTKLNLEMAATPEMIQIALEIEPDVVTLVPEKRQELTTEGGLNLKGPISHLRSYVEGLQKGGVPVSLFINPDIEDVKQAKELGAFAIELHTGHYAEAKNEGEVEREFQRIFQAAKLGTKMNLKVFAGHGLHYENISRLVKIPEIEEYNIGHSIIARAVFVGINEAVSEMKKLLKHSNIESLADSKFS